MRMTDEKSEWEQRILHALGLTPRGGRMRRWSYRNYYTVSFGDPVMEAMVERGLMVRRRPGKPGDLVCHHVTDAGAEFAGVGSRFRKEDRLQ